MPSCICVSTTTPFPLPNPVAGCATPLVSGKVKHIILGSCKPADEDFYNKINSQFGGLDTPTAAAGVLIAALTSTGYRDAQVAMVNVVEPTKTPAAPTEDDAGCGNTEFYSAGMEASYTSYSVLPLKATAASGNFANIDDFAWFNSFKTGGGNPYNRLMYIDCNNVIWAAYTARKVFSLETDSSIQSFNIYAQQVEKEIGNCKVKVGWKLSLKTTCDEPIFFPFLDLNALDGAAQAPWIAAGLM